MSYTEQVYNAEALAELLLTALEVQNKGLATVFFDLHGHVNQTVIEFHVPQWVKGEGATFKIEFENKCFTNAHKAKEELQAFILALPQLEADKTAKELADKRKQFEILKAELEQSIKAA